MIFELLALTTAALFTGAAFYINFAEQPARLLLDDANLLTEWKSAYARGLLMQASLALLSGLLALFALFIEKDWKWLLGALLILANWPFTFVFLMPINRELSAIAPANVGPNARVLIQRWGFLHMARTALGALATAVFVWAAMY